MEGHCSTGQRPFSCTCLESDEKLANTSATTAGAQCKGKGKVHPRIGHEVPEVEQRHISTLPSASAIDGLSGQRHAPAALPPGKNPVPIV